MEGSWLRVRKSKMAAKNQDGGQKFSILQTKKFSMVLKNHHAKYGACCHSVTGQAFLIPYRLHYEPSQVREEMEVSEF